MNILLIQKLLRSSLFQQMSELYNCIICGKPFLFEAEFCCNGDMCGCMGLPIYPPICSDECYLKAGYIPIEKVEK